MSTRYLYFVKPENIRCALYDFQKGNSGYNARVLQCTYSAGLKRFIVQISMNVYYPFLTDKWLRDWNDDPH